jgi:hypothetical protein
MGRQYVLGLRSSMYCYVYLSACLRKASIKKMIEPLLSFPVLPVLAEFSQIPPILLSFPSQLSRSVTFAYRVHGIFYLPASPPPRPCMLVDCPRLLRAPSVCAGCAKAARVARPRPAPGPHPAPCNAAVGAPCPAPALTRPRTGACPGGSGRERLRPSRGRPPSPRGDIVVAW